MKTMRNIRRIVITLICGYLATFVCAGLLARLGAGYGWFYGLGICAMGVITYRILVPALGVPSNRLSALRRRRHKEEPRLSGPIH
jgi:hypothetical protein